MSDSVVHEERKQYEQQQQQSIMVRAGNQQTENNDATEVEAINNGLSQMQNMVVGLAAIRYLLDTAIEAVQQRRAQQQQDEPENEGE